jgi:hypothetical protein
VGGAADYVKEVISRSGRIQLRRVSFIEKAKPFLTRRARGATLGVSERVLPVLY